MVDLVNLANKLNEKCDGGVIYGKQLKWTKENLIEGKNECYTIAYCDSGMCLECRKTLDETLRNQLKKYDICELCVDRVMVKLLSVYGCNTRRRYFSEEIIEHHVHNYHYDYCKNCAVINKINVIKNTLHETTIDSESICESLNEIIDLIRAKEDEDDCD